MQDIDELPLEQWAEQLQRARIDAGLERSGLAQALMLSSAQLQGLESGSLSAFHGPGYYIRAVEKYARHLNIQLEPPVTELRLTDSQIALNRVKNSPSAAKLAKRESQTLSADALPGASRPSKAGVWLGALLLILIGAGTWLAIKEGWLGNRKDTVAQTVADSTIKAQTPATAVPPTVEPADPVLPKREQTPAIAETSVTPTANVQIVTEATAVVTPSQPESGVAAVAQATTGPIAEPATEPAQVPEPVSAQISEPQPAVAVATESETRPQAAASPAPEVIEAQFNADCWVEVRFTDGRVEQAIYKPGQTLSVPIAEISLLTFGNAQAVSASRAGNPLEVNAFTRGGNNVARLSAQDLR
ncbi:helix-turn-helix domain-containing protein [Orrella daihaiensis]|uniref:DUF4115 domain-containing protein n=1 Tax=Orrella daihaiensis TaxID=2782176 RepID=A0ABY4ALI4_9BURK|nr:helix-turn-helix domain-containing protein [Orrella daihaiensis]UOD51132.1 DUF4115 domain-containing protein [Orrella daihaiensis]